MNILDNPRPRIVTLDDEKEYTLSPLNLYILGELEEELNCNTTEIIERLKTRLSQTLAKFIFVLLKDNYAEFKSAKDVGKMIVSVPKIDELFKTVLDMLTESTVK